MKKDKMKLIETKQIIPHEFEDTLPLIEAVNQIDNIIFKSKYLSCEELRESSVKLLKNIEIIVLDLPEKDKLWVTYPVYLETNKFERSLKNRILYMLKSNGLWISKTMTKADILIKQSEVQKISFLENMMKEDIVKDNEKESIIQALKFIRLFLTVSENGQNEIGLFKKASGVYNKNIMESSLKHELKNIGVKLFKEMEFNVISLYDIIKKESIGLNI